MALGATGSARLTPQSGIVRGEITGASTLAVGRSGFSPAELVLTAANSFTGRTEVTQGSTLTVANTGALGAAGNTLLLDNGRLQTFGASGAPLVLGAGMALQIGDGGAGFFANGQSVVIERALTGNAPLRIGGGSQPGNSGAKYDVRLANAGNSFVANLSLGDPQGLGSAALGIVADGALGAAGNRVTLGGTIFDDESTNTAQGGLRAWAPVVLAASRVILLAGEPGSFAGWIDTNGFSFTLQGGISQM